MAAPTYTQAMQHAWVVEDIDAAAERFSAALGIGPFFIAEYQGQVFEQATHLGKPTELHLKTAIAYSGDTQVELVQPMGTGPSIYTLTSDMLPGRFHHMCFWSSDLDHDLAHYEQQGCKTVDVGKMRGGPRFAYLDARPTLGCVIELLEYDARIAKLFDSWRDRNHAWDGNDALVYL